MYSCMVYMNSEQAIECLSTPHRRARFVSSAVVIVYATHGICTNTAKGPEPEPEPKPKPERGLDPSSVIGAETHCFAHTMPASVGAAVGIVFVSTADGQQEKMQVQLRLTLCPTGRARIAALAQPLIDAIFVESMSTLQYPALFALFVIAQTDLTSASVDHPRPATTHQTPLDTVLQNNTLLSELCNLARVENCQT